MNPYEKYKQQSIMTMTQGEMLSRLYEEIVTQLQGAVILVGEKDYVRANTALQKAQRIISHLKSTLDFQYEVSENLRMLYDFFNLKIRQANVSKDMREIEEIIPMVTQLKETFQQADRIARTG
jgi:flagellar protein FliS